METLFDSSSFFISKNLQACIIGQLHNFSTPYLFVKWAQTWACPTQHTL